MLPAETKSVGDEAFSQYGALESITADENNRYFSSDGGMLFNKDKTDGVFAVRFVMS